MAYLNLPVGLFLVDLNQHFVSNLSISVKVLQTITMSNMMNKIDNVRISVFNPLDTFNISLNERNKIG